jgi:hypothetical protein
VAAHANGKGERLEPGRLGGGRAGGAEAIGGEAGESGKIGAREQGRAPGEA